jgi:hypothetical protein
MVLPAARTGEASAESATTDIASVEANARRPRRMSWNIEVLLTGSADEFSWRVLLASGAADDSGAA